MSEAEIDDDLADAAAPSKPRTAASRPSAATSIDGVRIGVLVGLTDQGKTPLVIFSGQSGKSAVSARAAMDLCGVHLGREVILAFEEGDPLRPIVLGCLQREGWPAEKSLDQVEVDADGRRMLISAKEQLVLRCGAASITLTRTGKILVSGTYVSTTSTGMNRIKGGSVQIN